MKYVRFALLTGITIGLLLSCGYGQEKKNAPAGAKKEHTFRGKVEKIDATKVLVTPADAMARANQFAGTQLPTTALTLLMRDGRLVYQAVGGMGADSLLIDAETGAVIKTPPPGFLTRYFRQAHFYFFASSWQVPLLIIFSALACLSALSGIYLNLTLWLRRRARTN